MVGTQHLPIVQENTEVEWHIHSPNTWSAPGCDDYDLLIRALEHARFKLELRPVFFVKTLIKESNIGRLAGRPRHRSNDVLDFASGASKTHEAHDSAPNLDVADRLNRRLSLAM